MGYENQITNTAPSDLHAVQHEDSTSSATSSITTSPITNHVPQQPVSDQSASNDVYVEKTGNHMIGQYNNSNSNNNENSDCCGCAAYDCDKNLDDFLNDEEFRAVFAPLESLSDCDSETLPPPTHAECA